MLCMYHKLRAIRHYAKSLTIYYMLPKVKDALTNN